MTRADDQGAAYIPTPDEIAEACRLIRLGWDEKTRRDRAGANANPAARVKVLRVDEPHAEDRNEWNV